MAQTRAAPRAVRGWLWVLLGLAILAAAGFVFVARRGPGGAPGSMSRPKAPEVITDQERETLDAVIEERTGERSD